MPARKIDEDEFRRMWRAGVSEDDIAARFDVTVKAVQGAARRFGLKPRGKSAPLGRAATRAAPVAVAGEGAVGVVGDAPPRTAMVLGAPGWSAGHDNAIRDTGGRYAALADVAAAQGRTLRAVTARWHQLRGG